MKNFVLFIFLLTAIAGCKKDTDLPEGVEWIGNAGKIHFVYAPETYLSNEVELRETGKVICTVRFEQQDYCQVYFWYDRKDVPAGLPIVNRNTLFAIYELKNGIMNLKKTKERK